MHKHGKKNSTQHYKCKSCNKTFSFNKKLDPISIWIDYMS
ncbi:IS1/IS1595 family N-terminal zinc-binding domain-containing protein, partial [Mannheimia indoligenes]